VSTRKLIIASLVCGLLILVAGSVKLLQTATDVREPPTLLRIGGTATVGNLVVTVDDIRTSRVESLVDVTMQFDNSVSIDQGDVVAGWSMLANGRITSARPESVCIGEASELRCTLQFGEAIGTPTIVFARNGEKAQWLGS
jgi:hypothetical protein